MEKFVALGYSPRHVRRRRVAIAIVTAFTSYLFVAAPGVGALADDRQINFEIRPQNLQAALLKFSEQAGVQLIVAANTRGLRLRQALDGTMDVQRALELLTSGTNLEFAFTGENTVTIRERVSVAAAARPTENLPTSDQYETERTAPVIEEIVSVGTRARGRTATETPIPVDVFSRSSLVDTGQAEVGRMIQTLAPSFNFPSSTVSDGTDALRPATLRGLGPDQTLVLINGKRRHTSALVHVNSSVGRGTAGVDMNAIPGAGIARIEVLRDGAAAQYGSDAIAGVINLVLDDRNSGGEFSASYGETYAGDGAVLNVSASAGFELGSEGFLTLTADYRDRGATNRAGLSGAVQYPLLDNGGACDAVDNSGCDPREFTFERRNFRVGDASTESTSLVLNGRIPLGDKLDLYGFATYTDRQNQSAGFYRRANEFEQTVTEIYPNGFLPLINTNIEDFGGSVGLSWETEDGWALDFSANHGSNSFQFVISNSLNASLGASSPTRADAGTLIFNQSSFNLDMVRFFKWNGQEVSLAFGAEYRTEQYEIEAGQPVSYIDGGAVNQNCPGCDVSPIPYDPGFQVFQGLAPENEIDADRWNISAYLDMEYRPVSRWLITGALRMEEYSDFGGTLTGKLSSRFDLTESFALRGSISSGFRAPSMQQKHFNSISTQYVEIGDVTVGQQRGTYSNDSLVAHLAGVPELKEETSNSYSAGLVAGFGNATLTADYYHIEIQDRIGISGAIDLMQPGFEEVASITSAGQFFVNAADTVTSGIDVVLAVEVPMPAGQSLRLSAAGNWTDTDVVEGSIATSIGGVVVGPLFTKQDVSILEDWQPNQRINLAAHYSVGPWQITARASEYGRYTVCEGACDSTANIQTYGAEWLLDLHLSYRFAGGFSLALGANNIFDNTPDQNQIGQARAGDILGVVSSPGVFTYSRRSAPFGFNGGYWFVRGSYTF